jgi:uncharacterized membrane protein
MNDLSQYLTGHWLSVVLLVLALLCGAVVLWKRLRGASWPWGWSSLGVILGLLGIGGMALPYEIALWMGAGVLGAFFLAALVLIITGEWFAPLGWGLGGLFFLALGGVGSVAAGEGLEEAWKVALSLEPTKPWWLLMLLFIPVIILLSYRSLAGLGPVRRWIAIALRCTLVLLLTLALAEVRLRHDNESTTVLFVVDRSYSIPEDPDPEINPDSGHVDRRWQRVEKFINDAVALRGSAHKNDRAGLILFGRRPRLELPPSPTPAFNWKFVDAASSIDGYYTDIAASIKLALASFPEGSGKRIVLISDGNENLGNAEEQARIAKLNGAQIDVVPLAASYRNENEVLVQSVEAPTRIEQGSRLPIRVLVRSYNPRTVWGTLVVKQIADAESTPIPGSPMRVQVKPGLNAFSFQKPLGSQQQSYTIQAVFQPEASLNDKGEMIAGLPGDRVQNNSATTHVIALGSRRILLVEQRQDEHQLLARRLREIGNAKFKVHTITADKLPEDRSQLGVFLSEYDCVILANVPAELLNEDQQEMIRTNTHDQGCGLVMIGGPDSFGSGGWQGTPVEKALPVDCDIKSFKVQGKGGLALIMHASEMADGNRWQKEIAKLAIKKLTSNDEVGILHYDLGQHKWHIPLQQIRSKKPSLLAQVDRMIPGDMPDFDPPLKMAYEKLIEPERELSVKHVIIISDGDPQQSNAALLQKMKRDKVTVTTVGVATHGPSFDQNLKAISDKTGGRFYKVLSPRALPAIYVRETRVVSQSFLHEKRFVPKLEFKDGPTDKMPDTLNALYGFVRTSPKQSQLVQIPITGPPSADQVMPILAYWTYGLGKAVAFTSDARSMPGRPAWDREWAGSDMYSKFWEQVVEWALRPTETGRLVMTPEYSDGKVKVTIDARDSANHPLTELVLDGAVSVAEQSGMTMTTPQHGDDAKRELHFVQKAPGQYEAEFKAADAGSYFINANAKRQVKSGKDGKEVMNTEVESVRSGVTVPYSPEFADMESNATLLEKIRDATGGKNISEDLLAQAADPNNPQADDMRHQLAGEVFRPGLPQFKNLQPIWYWLVFFAGVLLFFDVAVRRIALEPVAVAAAAERVWLRLRGRANEIVQTPEFMDRLQSRKLQVGDTLEQLRSARRFEGGELVGAAPPGADEAAAAQGSLPATRVAPPRIAPDKKEDAADYASRLMKAKERVWQERDKEKENE